MAAYMIADVEVMDEAEYRVYAQEFDAILARFGGRILVVGGNPRAVEGEWIPRRLVIPEFPTTEAALQWNASPEYGVIAPIRQQHAVTHFVTLFEGFGQSSPG